MDFAKVSVELRSKSGKGSARKARANGRVPGVLYGRKEEPVSVILDPAALVKSLDKEKKRNTVFNLSVADGSGGATGKDVLAMVRDVQIDPLSRQIIHVDFLRVSMEDDVKVTVPLVLKGVPVGVTNGGNLHHTMHSIPVATKPNAIPNKVEIDVSALDIGEALHASDLKLPEGVRVLLKAKEAIASVVAPRQEKETAATPAEGALAAGAAPAAGGAAPAAAAGAEKGGDKKEGGEKKGK